MEFTIKQLSPKLLNDYLAFFDNVHFSENPDWSICYCFSYHFVGTSEQWNRESNRSSAIQYVKEGKLTGYLAYYNNEVVGWCNANNRSNYQRLLKYYDLIDNPGEKICSIVCFLIHPDFRRKGIAQKILQQICEDYSKKGYDYVEAYPGKGQLSCEGHYKGPIELYSKFDFKIVKEHQDYYTVRRSLN